MARSTVDWSEWSLECCSAEPMVVRWAHHLGGCSAVLTVAKKDPALDYPLVVGSAGSTVLM